MKSILSQERVFITGGGGFMGSHIAKRLVDLGYEVHLLWRKDADNARLEDYRDKFIFHNVDIFDVQKLKTKLLKINPQIIIHLAAYSKYRNNDDVEKIIKTSVTGTLNLLTATENIPYKIFINTGSSSEYGFNKLPMKESDCESPQSFYAVAKVSQTHLCKMFAKYYNKPIVTVRPFSVYGPFEDASRLVPTVIMSLRHDKPIFLTKGSLRRDFIYIEDIVDAYLKIIMTKKKLIGEIINLGTGKEYSNDRVVRTLFKIAQKKCVIKKGSFKKRIWDSPHWVCDTSHAKKLLNWEAKNSLEDGLKKTYNWFLNKKAL